MAGGIVAKLRAVMGAPAAYERSEDGATHCTADLHWLCVGIGRRAMALRRSDERNVLLSDDRKASILTMPWSTRKLWNCYGTTACHYWHIVADSDSMNRLRCPATQIGRLRQGISAVLSAEARTLAHNQLDESLATRAKCDGVTKSLTCEKVGDDRCPSESLHRIIARQRKNEIDFLVTASRSLRPISKPARGRAGRELLQDRHRHSLIWLVTRLR